MKCIIFEFLNRLPWRWMGPRWLSMNVILLYRIVRRYLSSAVETIEFTQRIRNTVLSVGGIYIVIRLYYAELLEAEWQKRQPHFLLALLLELLPYPSNFPYFTLCIFFLFLNLRISLAGQKFELNEEPHLRGQKTYSPDGWRNELSAVQFIVIFSTFFFFACRLSIYRNILIVFSCWGSKIFFPMMLQGQERTDTFGYISIKTEKNMTYY